MNQIKLSKQFKRPIIKNTIFSLSALVIFGLGFALGINYAHRLYFRNTFENDVNPTGEHFTTNEMSFYYRLNKKAEVIEKKHFDKSNRSKRDNSNIQIEKSVVGDSNIKLIPSSNVRKDSHNEKSKLDMNLKRYRIQVYSFKYEDVSKKIVSNLLQKGYPAYISLIELGQNGTYYRVRIGQFETKNEALEILNNVKNSINKEAFIVYE